MKFDRYTTLTQLSLAAGLMFFGDMTAEAQAKPNVLMISVDDLNDWVGKLNGHPKAVTPNLDRLMERSVYFTNAHCNAPVCFASRNSLLSGLRPSTTGWYSNSVKKGEYKSILKGHPVMPLHFRNNGYHTMAVGKVYHHGVADYLKDEQWDQHRKPIELTDEIASHGQGYGDKGAGEYFYPFPKGGGQFFQKYGKSNGSISLCWAALERDEMPEGKMPDEHFADWAVTQLKKEYDKPFFMAVGFARPHVPYTAPKEYFDLYDPEQIALPPVAQDEMSDIPVYGKAMSYGLMKKGDHKGVESMGPNYRRELVHAYLACVSMVDAQIGKVLNALETSGKADNTIVVLWSDHGQNFGEKFNYRKMCLWEESTRVPLSIYNPTSDNKAAQTPRSVTLLDLYPTLIELCGLPQLPKLEGNSLVPLLETPSRTWDHAALTTWHYQNHSVRTEKFRYIRYRDGKEELYDHTKDPGEHTNVAGLEKYFEDLKQLRTHLPETNVFPGGLDSWDGDILERVIDSWNNTDGIPAYLK